MKHLLLIFSLYISFTACKSSKNEKLFYDENNTNRTKEILTYNNDLFIIGQHNFTENNIERTTSILCIDTNFNKKWDFHLGDNKTDERFQNFTTDKQGNLYITRNIGSLNTSILIKTNTRGQLLWRKEFKNTNSLNQIKFLSDNSIIVIGTKRFSETDLLKDSSFIQKMDTSGNIIWKTPICKDMVLRFLELSKNKIIFCASTTDFIEAVPYCNLFILNQNGTIEKNVKFDFSNTGIDHGVKPIRLLVNENKEISILFQSFSNYNLQVQLAVFDSLGKSKRVITFDPKAEIAKSEAADKIYLHTGLVISSVNKKPALILLKQKNTGEVYFTKNTEFDNSFSFTGSVIIKNKTYTVGDLNNFQKPSAIWKITKSD